MPHLHIYLAGIDEQRKKHVLDEVFDIIRTKSNNNDFKKYNPDDIQKNFENSQLSQFKIIRNSKKFKEFCGMEQKYFDHPFISQQSPFDFLFSTTKKQNSKETMKKIEDFKGYSTNVLILVNPDKELTKEQQVVHDSLLSNLKQNCIKFHELRGNIDIDHSAQFVLDFIHFILCRKSFPLRFDKNSKNENDISFKCDYKIFKPTEFLQGKEKDQQKTNKAKNSKEKDMKSTFCFKKLNFQANRDLNQLNVVVKYEMKEPSRFFHEKEFLENGNVEEKLILCNFDPFVPSQNVERMLKNGIDIDGKRFFFLGCSNSQLKTGFNSIQFNFSQETPKNFQKN